MVVVVLHYAQLTVLVQHVHRCDAVASSACVICLARMLFPSMAYAGAEPRPQAWTSSRFPE